MRPTLITGFFAACLVPLLSAQNVTVFNNWDNITSVSLSAQGGSSASIGEFWGITGNNQLRIVSATSANFAQYAKTPAFGRNDAFLTALASGESIAFDYRAFDTDNAITSFTLRFLVNTNANSLGYGGAGSQITVSGTTDVSGTFTWNYASNANFMNALNSYRTNTGVAGTFFEFYLDNAGFPGLPTPATFSIDNLRVVSAIPEPSAFAALAGIGALGITAVRRRRRSA